MSDILDARITQSPTGTTCIAADIRLSVWRMKTNGVQLSQERPDEFENDIVPADSGRQTPRFSADQFDA